jgi:hypothetical protein
MRPTAIPVKGETVRLLRGRAPFACHLVTVHTILVAKKAEVSGCCGQGIARSTLLTISVNKASFNTLCAGPAAMLAPRLPDTPFLHPSCRCQKMGKGLGRRS